MPKNKATVSPADVQKHLSGVDYPCSKQDLIQTARDEGAGDDVIELLQNIPDKDYNSPADVSKAVGKVE